MKDKANKIYEEIVKLLDNDLVHEARDMINKLFEEDNILAFNVVDNLYFDRGFNYFTEDAQLINII